MNNYEDSLYTTTDEVKKNNNRFTLSKFESDLFDEEKEKIIEPITRVKRFALPNDGENWKIYHNNDVVFIIEGLKLTKKERSFLRSERGVFMLLSEFKKEVKALSFIKKKIKELLSS